ncbi:MAG TPA: hypothetical protein VF476_10075 [Chitinophagaceae bacterium]
MKKLFLVLMVTGFASVINAQQKPSERSFADEVRKVQEKKAARNRLVNQQPQSGTTQPAVAPAPVAPAPNDKPSARPMKVPAKRKL